jgi:hypothetical protein
MTILPDAVTTHLTVAWERFIYVSSADELFHYLHPACAHHQHHHHHGNKHVLSCYDINNIIHFLPTFDEDKAGSSTGIVMAQLLLDALASLPSGLF